MKKDGHELLKGHSLAVGKLYNKILGKDFEGTIKISSYLVQIHK